MVNSIIRANISLVNGSSVIVAVGAGTFVFSAQLASLIVALPSMAEFLQPFSPDWALTTYLLSLAALLLLFGRAGDIIGNKRFYVAGLVAFLGASILCAVATSSAAFLAGRIVQGIGAALSAANSPVILTRSVSPLRRGRALGYQAAITYLGLTIGPGVGAFAVKHFNWRGLFWLNVPLGLVAILLAFISIPPDTVPAASLKRLRLLDTAVWLVCLLPLLLALNRGAQWGWRSPSICGLIFLSVIAFTSFLVIESRSSGPLLDLALLRNRVVLTSIACEGLFYVELYAIGFLLPMLVVRGRGYSAASVGTLLTAQSLTRIFAAPIGGIASDQWGTRKILLTAAGCAGLGALALLCTFRTGSIFSIGVAVVLVGLGTGIFVPVNISRLFSHVSPRDRGMASGVMATTRNLGMMLGVAVAAAVYFTFAPGVTSGVAALAGSKMGLSFVFVLSCVIVIANLLPSPAKVPFIVRNVLVKM